MRSLIFLAFITLGFSFTSINNDNTGVKGTAAEIFRDDIFTSQNAKPSSKALVSVNPDTAQLLNVIGIGSAYSALSPNGKILLMYDGTKSFQIYDVSNPEFPAFASSYHLNVTLPVHLASAIISPDSKTAFITYCDMGTESLEVVDISNSASPTKITTHMLYQNTGAFMISPDSQGMAISSDGQTVFVWVCIWISSNSDNSMMSAIDVSNITNPTEISNLSYSHEVDCDNPALSLVDDKLFFNDGSTLVVVNISEVEKPSIVSNISTARSASLAVSSDGKNAAIVGSPDDLDSIGSVLIYNLSNPTSPINISLGSHLSAFGPQLVAISPSNNYVFVAGGSNLMIVNITDNQNLTYGTINTISSPTSITLSSDGRTAYIASEFQLTIVEICLDVQMSQVFNLPANDKIQNVSLKSNVTYNELQTMVISSDRNIAFVLHSYSYFEIFDISNLESPNFLGVFNIINDSNCNSVILSPDETVAFVTCSEEVIVIDITNLTSPTYLAEINDDSVVAHFDLSLDGKVGFLTMDFAMLTMNLSKITSVPDIDEANSPHGLDAVSFGLSQDTNLGFMLLQNFSNYRYSLLSINTSNVSSLTNISLLYIGDSGDGQTLEEFYVSISPNNEAVFITLEINGVDLQIYDISNPISPVRITWPGLNIPTSQAVVFSQDSKTAFIATNTELLVLDISTLALPMILRAYSVPNIVSIVLSKDESIAYLGTTDGTLFVVSLKPEYAFDVWERGYELGGIYSYALVPLQINSDSKFNPMSQNYSFLEVSLYGVQTSPGAVQTVTVYPPLPNWISFEPDLKELTVSPIAAAHIGSYQIYGALSTFIPNDVFDGLISNSTEAEDLFATLTSLGYISTQGFLTSNFDPNSKLVLFSQYSGQEQEIRQILSQYYIEITASISVTSSLSLTLSDSILVDTKSQSTLSLVIQVNKTQAQFVSSNYAAVTIISSDYSTISMQGSLVNINTALAEIIINLSDGISECDGSIAISDGLNPSVNQSITNISQYFFHDQAPAINPNLSIQTEIDQTSIRTGEEFMVDLANTFVDPNGQDLEYSLSMQDDSQQVPQWLMLRGQALVGTPPEQISNSEIDLILTAKNQFKSLGIPITIKIKISVLYGFKLVATYGGILITIIGLYIYINTIYNILCRKRYRYPKDFTIKVGDEMSVHNICTLGFIGKEIRVSKAVFQELKKAVARELNVESVSENEFSVHFADKNTECLLEEKLISMIRREILNLEEKNKFNPNKYWSVQGHLRKEVIQQLVINEVLAMLVNLPQEKRTKRVFNALKNDWVHLVELGSGPMQYELNQSELKKRIKKAGVWKYNTDWRKDRIYDSNNENIQAPLIAQNSENTRGYDNVNFDLLERLIIAVAFRYHNLDIDPIYTKIVINQQPAEYTLWVKIKKLFKRDLLQVEFAGIGNIGYGMKYEVQKDFLRFYGAPERELKNTTLAVHIMNKRGRILRELWIKCIDKESTEETGY